MSGMARRRWGRSVGAFALMTVVGASPGGRGSHGATSPTELRVGVLTQGGSGRSWREGLRLALEEHEATGPASGVTIELLEPREELQGAEAFRALVAAGADVVIGSLPALEWSEVEEAARGAQVLLVDARPVRTGAVRCSANLFRLGIPSSGDLLRVPTAMGSAGALGLLASADPAPVGGPHQDEPGTMSDALFLWYASLDRSGARELNERFRQRFERGMDGAAWTAWFALRVVIQSAKATRSSDPTLLAQYLVAPATTFDGAKGTPLRFREEDHQLMHPLYYPADAGRWSELQWPWNPLGQPCPLAP